MSSVLKALKKLEKEQPSPDIHHGQWLGKIPLERSLLDRFRQGLPPHQFTSGTWAAVLVLLIGVMAILLSVEFFQSTSFVVFSGKSSDKALTLKPVLNKNEQGRSIPATVVPDQGVTTFSKIASGRQATAPDRFQTPVSNPPSAARTSAESVPLNATIPVSKPIKKQSLKKKTIEEQATTSIEEPPLLIGRVSSETVSATAAPDVEYNAEILNDSAMKIQAISWNKSPSRRLAMISSHVVRQGDPIEQYTVIQINPDDIILVKDAKMWKILF